MNSKLIFTALLSLVAVEISQIEPSASAPSNDKTQQQLTSISNNSGKGLIPISGDIEVKKNAKGNNELSWKKEPTRTESFLIQRSADGKKFKTIGRRSPKENISSYFFEDAGYNKQAYYRIIEVDVDGRVMYSEPVSIKK